MVQYRPYTKVNRPRQPSTNLTEGENTLGLGVPIHRPWAPPTSLLSLRKRRNTHTTPPGVERRFQERPTLVREPLRELSTHSRPSSQCPFTHRRFGSTYHPPTPPIDRGSVSTSQTLVEKLLSLSKEHFLPLTLCSINSPLVYTFLFYSWT